MRPLHRCAVLSPLLLTAACRVSLPNEDRREVLATVDRFFDAIESGDPEVASSAVLPDAAFANVRTLEGELAVKHFTQREFQERRAKETRRMHEEFVGRPSVLIEGDIATVWGAYTFRYDDQLSHTGVDAFTLLRTKDGWRIAGGAYSVVPVKP